MLVLVQYDINWESCEEWVHRYSLRWDYLINQCDGQEVAP